MLNLNYTHNSNDKQNNHYYQDHKTRGGKRQPCPKCDSKTQYHEGKHGLRCFACGYVPGREDSAVIPLVSKITKPLCNCGNPLNSKAQIKLNKCYFCQVIEVYPLGDGRAMSLAAFAYAKNKGLSGLVLSIIGARLIKLYGEIQLCYPLKNEHGQTGYQVIDDRGNKKYAYPKHDSDSFFHTFIGNPNGKFGACEGMATAISGKTALPNETILICGNADGFIKAAKLYGSQIDYFMADNDKSGVGLAKAQQAAELCQAKVWLCPIISDFNDLHMAKGLQAIRDSFAQMGNFSLNLAYQSGIKVETIDSLTDFKASKGVTILLSPMGTGKTKIVASQLVKESQTFAYISYLRSLDSDASAKLGLTSYQQTKTTHNNMSICINSIESYSNEFETLFIDEAHAVIDTLTLPGSTIKEQKRTFDNLITKMSNAKRVIFATATAGLSHLQAIEIMAAKAGMAVKIIVCTEQGRAKEVNLIDFETFTDKWQTGMANEKRVMIFCDSVDNVKTIESQAKELFPNRKILAVHGDNSHEHVAGLAQSYVNYDMVILSPSVTAGVSLEIPHFDLTMAYFVGNHLSPLDATQALARYRPADEVFICIDKLAKSTHAPIFDVDKELEKIRQDNITQLNGIASKFNIDLKQALASYQFTDFDRICAINRAHAESNKAQFKPMFLATIKAQSWQVSELVSMDGRAARLAHRIAKAEVIEAECRAIATRNLISDYEAEVLSKKLELSEDERHALKRYQAHTIFGTNEPDDIKEIFKDDLIHKARILAQYQSPHYANIKFEQDMVKAVTGARSIVGLENRIANNEFITALFNGANILHGQGAFDLSCATFSINSDFTEIEAVLEKYNLFARKRTKKVHVLVANELRNLGFIVSSQRAKGARGEKRHYEFTVTGFNDLVEHGMAYFTKKFAMSLVSTSRQMMIIESPITRNGHQTELESSLSEFLTANDKRPTISGQQETAKCSHSEMDEINGQATCLHCGQKWQRPIDYLIDFVAQNGGF